MLAVSVFYATASLLAWLVRIGALIVVIIRPVGAARRLALPGFALLLGGLILETALSRTGLGSPASQLFSTLPHWFDELVWAVVEVLTAIGIVLIAAALDRRPIRWRERALPLVLLMIVLEVIIAVVVARGLSPALVAQLAQPVVGLDGAVVGLVLIIGAGGRARTLGLAGVIVIMVSYLIDIVRRTDYWLGGGVPSLFPPSSAVDMSPAFAYAAFHALTLAAGLALLLLAVLQRAEVSPAAAVRSSR